MLNDKELLYEEIFPLEKLHPTVLLPQRILYGLSLILIYISSSLRVYLCTKSSLYERTVHWIIICCEMLFEVLTSLFLIPFYIPMMLVIVVGVVSLAVLPGSTT